MPANKSIQARQQLRDPNTGRFRDEHRQSGMPTDESIRKYEQQPRPPLPITMFGRPRWSGPGRRFRYDFPALSSMIRGVLSPGTGTPDDPPHHRSTPTPSESKTSELQNHSGGRKTRLHAHRARRAGPDTRHETSHAIPIPHHLHQIGNADIEKYQPPEDGKGRRRSGDMANPFQ